MVFSPTFDPSDLAVKPGLGQRLATFNAEVAAAVNLLSDTAEVLTGRIVGVEMAHRTLADGAQAALLEVLSQARAEFQAQGSSLLALRAEVQKEMVEFRGYLLETRGVLEQLYKGSRATSPYSSRRSARPTGRSKRTARGSSTRSRLSKRTTRGSRV